ncbi:helix-turn-helix transcriptional regulator [Ferrovibrio sp.]|uniref:helix-turn-helix domain-containing protein n=1 Tax=Ferrovibrio sp. TaxID=1917215 RepID=UPI000CCABFF8|nr:helix-turn-helix transcriptional regulator [Ferrovibrio sp.]PJI42177.1 MAG: transcriptional regulator [Ferrovibrio sp.]
MGYVREDLIKRFRDKRVAAKISQRALSERSGLTQSHISQIETGSLDPGLSSFLQMARALDLELVLVPRKLVPAVEAIDRENEVALTVGYLPTRDILRIERVLSDYQGRKGISGDIVEIKHLVEFLQNAPLNQKDLKEFRSILDAFEGQSTRTSDKFFKKSLLALRALRNRIAHPRTEEPRPAYSADDGDEDA